jgi:hypothetical protein
VRITLVSSNRSDSTVGVYRPNQDRFSPLYGDRRRHLVISAPAGMKPTAILAAIADQLDDEELLEVADTFGLETDTHGPEVPQNT